jgi:hypothetical protein
MAYIITLPSNSYAAFIGFIFDLSTKEVEVLAAIYKAMEEVVLLDAATLEQVTPEKIDYFEEKILKNTGIKPNIFGKYKASLTKKGVLKDNALVKEALLNSKFKIEYGKEKS